jgi:hypothetical protein
VPETSAEPFLRPIVESKPPAEQLFSAVKTSFNEKPLTYSEAEQRVAQALKETAKKNPTIPVEKIRDTVFPVFYGPLLLSEKTHLEGTKGFEQGEKLKQNETSARIQHALTHSMLHATSEEASDKYLVNMYDHARRMQLLCESNFGRQYNFGLFWSGVKSELAVINALQDSGKYRVLIPDYSQDPSTTPPEENEVLQWDVLSGTDIIAISNDGSEAILIDVKGRKNVEVNGMLQENTDVSVMPLPLDRTKVNPLIQKTLDSFGVKTVTKKRITIPTGKQYLGTPSLPAIPSEDYKSTLKEFFSLKPHLANDIITKLDTSEPMKLAA